MSIYKLLEGVLLRERKRKKSVQEFLGETERTISKNQHHITVNDSWNPVGHSDHRAILEVILDQLLNDSVSVGINRCCGFMNDKDAAML